MNPGSKLMLSDEELQLVNNREWILTKRIIIEKAMALFGMVSHNMQSVIEKEKYWLPAAVVRSSPKIAKGENYLLLPYLLLDYPRCFEGENIFAVRTMFWWGNFFSITLHISGIYKNQFQQNIMDNLVSVKQDFFICVHESQWHHHFEEDNYKLLDLLKRHEINEIIAAKPFIKLAVHFPLPEWDHVTERMDVTFREIIELLKRSASEAVK
ncbi:MAG: hypothetical protein IPI54_05830 [Chitinophagaceae bacterium]|nr:hypothetical protein [Chitinophagaceae bacterium]